MIVRILGIAAAVLAVIAGVAFVVLLVWVLVGAPTEPLTC